MTVLPDLHGIQTVIPDNRITSTYNILPYEYRRQIDIPLPSPQIGVTGKWPMFQHDAANTGHAPEETGPTASVTEQWRFETSAMVMSPPAVADDAVYVANTDGMLYKLAADTGTVHWQFEMANEHDSPPAVADGTVFVGGRMATSMRSRLLTERNSGATKRMVISSRPRHLRRIQSTLA